MVAPHRNLVPQQYFLTETRRVRILYSNAHSKEPPPACCVCDGTVHPSSILGKLQSSKQILPLALF
jgi:hypothetical protein